ncbi:MAG: type VI secretion system baseplate subunit TssE [Pseudomonadota bacterium]
MSEPALIDRLTDPDPASKSEPASAGQISPRRMREIIRRDLAALLGTVSVDGRLDLSRHPFVAASALNFGIRDFSGESSDALDTAAAAREIREAIHRYEPRLQPDTLSVDVDLHGEARDVLSLSISGVYAPSGESIALEAEIDLETGAARLVEGRG